MRRLLLLVALLALALPSVAAAQLSTHEILGDESATELANELAEATDEQDICYGWYVSVSTGLPDQGSNLGPDKRVTSGGCEKYVEIVGDVDWTCSSCEAEDSSSFHVETNIPSGAPTKQQIRDLGLSGGDLHKDNGSDVLEAMAGALPLLAAGNGIAKSIPTTLNTKPIPASDKAENSPSMPDWLRESWLALCVFLVIIAGAVWLFFNENVKRRRARPTPTVTSAAPPPSDS